MKLLITGGAGYIGSHIAVTLIMQGYDCLLLDSLENGSADIVERINQITNKQVVLIQGNIQDKELLQSIFDTHEIEGVVHCAGYKAVGESCDNPFLYYQNNIQGTLTLLETMIENSCRKMLFSSSATVYDMSQAPKEGYTENDLVGKTSNPYGTTKLVVEQLIRDLSLHKRLQAICLRYFNPIGAHPSGLIGENPQGIPNNLFPYILKVLKGDLKELTIFGDDYDTLDGTGIRDYIDINDLAEGHYAARKYLCQQNPGFHDTINLGTGRGVSVSELVATTEVALGKKVKKRIGARRPGDAALSLANVAYAYKKLGRTAKRPLQQSILSSRKYSCQLRR